MNGRQKLRDLCYQWFEMRTALAKNKFSLRKDLKFAIRKDRVKMPNNCMGKTSLFWTFMNSTDAFLRNFLHHPLSFEPTFAEWLGKFYLHVIKVLIATCREVLVYATDQHLRHSSRTYLNIETKKLWNYSSIKSFWLLM